MYRKKGREWTKHVDFMLLDILCIQLAFIAAYIFRLNKIAARWPAKAVAQFYFY